MGQPLLAIRDLVTEFDTPDGTLRAADGVSYDVARGETVGVVGESGSGKSVTAMSVLGLIPQPPGRVVSGVADFEGRDLLALSPRELRRVRGKDIAMVFQDPMTSLNPVLTVGHQVAEAIAAHDDVDRREARERAVTLLASVRVPDASERFGQFPHELSGGMRQRVMIAMAIANQPKLLVADEPTTALDVTIQAQVLEVLRAAKEATNAATMLITHDLGVVAELADRVVVMYAGRVIEVGSVRRVFHEPRHPYTLGLLSSLPSLDRATDRLVPIPGSPPSLLERPSGCAFEPRCRLAAGRRVCRTDPPPLYDTGGGHRAACHFHDEMPTQIERLEAEAGRRITNRDDG